MLEIFYTLLFLTLVVTGGFIYRITRDVRDFRRQETDQPAGLYTQKRYDTNQTEWDLRFLRWTFIGWLATFLWGLATLAEYLITG